ncbi:putative ribonuclease H-like domain-containing protein [Tanacetum coccineum]
MMRCMFTQPPGFVDHLIPNKVYKVVKALYGLLIALELGMRHYLLSAWRRFEEVYIDKTLFIKKNKSDIMLVQVYVDDIIFGSTKKSMCTEFEEVKQQPDGIFISQDKYVADILKKFDFYSIKTATPIESNKPLVRMKMTSCLHVCACARFQVTLKASHFTAVKRIFRYLKHQPKLGLWYPRDSPFELEAFSDSNNARSKSLTGKSTTGYVVAAHLLWASIWIQNKLLDYGFNFIEHQNSIWTMRHLLWCVKIPSLSSRTRQRISMDLRMDRCSPGKYYSSMVFKQFWQTATVRTLANGTQQLVASIDSKEYTITEASGILYTLLPAMLAGAAVDQEPEDQGRIIQDIDDDPLVSLVRESMKKKSTDFVTPTKASGEAQEEEISPTILEAAKTLSKVASQGVSKEKSTDKGKRYRRRARSVAKNINIGLDVEEEINTGIKDVNTGSTKVNSGTAATKAKLKRYGEELQTKTSKKQRLDDKDVPAIGDKVDEEKEEEPVKRTGKRKKQKARKGVNVDKSAQEDSETDKEESVEAMNPTPLTTKSDSVVNWKIFQQEVGTNRAFEDDYDRVFGRVLRTMFDSPLNENAFGALHYIFCYADRKLSLSKKLDKLMLKMKLLNGKNK